MGVTSITQILTNSFLPILSGLQEEKERFERVARKMNRFSAYLVFPVMLFLVAAAEPIFHILFASKWDEAILLFQILIVRGIFVVLTSLYNQYILSLGKGKALVWYEIVKDAIMIGLILITLPYGVEIIVWGQLIASALFYIFSLFFTAHHTGYKVRNLIGDVIPYAVISIILGMGGLAIVPLFNPWIAIAIQAVGFFAIYVLVNKLLGSKVQKEVLSFAKTRKI